MPPPKRNGPPMNGERRDALFIRIFYVIAAVLVLFGIGSFVLALITDPSEQTIWRMIGAWGSMFSLVAGLATGYLIGR